MIKLITRKV